MEMAETFCVFQSYLATLSQLVENLICNHGVVSSSLTGGSKHQLLLQFRVFERRNPQAEESKRKIIGQ